MQTNTQVQYVRLKWYDLATNEDQERIAPLPVTLGCTSENTIVLNSQLVSRKHAELTVGPGGIILVDRESSQGTFVGQQRVNQVVLDDGNSFQVGPFHFTMTVVPPSLLQGTAKVQTPTLTTPEVELPLSAIFSHSIVPMDEVRRCPEPVLETTYLAIGGGIGSFAWVDHLRICGVPPEQIVVLGPEPSPTARYQRLTRNAQIPIHERLRSNSESCPDNIWGWPSYGLREIWQSLRRRQLRYALRIAVQIFGEPVLTDTYTPRAGDVFNAMNREARRIDWEQMWRYGWAQVLRKTDDDRYVVAYSGINEQGEQEQRFVVASYVHLSMGYPVIRLLADLQEYRQRTQDRRQVVHAYEEHEHIYEHLLEHGGVVIVRGRGIVASQVIQRLYQVRKQAQRKDVVILHVLRSPVPVGHQDGHARRPVKNHVELQPFNWPKACWSGPLRIRLERADDHQRDQMLNDWGGTTTADRKYWQRIAREGLQEGWYQIYFGQGKTIDRTPQGQLTNHLSTRSAHHPEVSFTADFIIDCTGLDAGLEYNPLLKDMVDCYQLRRNPKGRLGVANDFEVEGMGNGPRRVYASGSTTLGGPLAAADSFLGLQYAALRSVEALERKHAPCLQELTPLRSLLQWTRWIRGVCP